MKKFLVIVIVLMVSTITFGQHQTSRFGIPPKQNTGQFLNYAVISKLDTIKKDTQYVMPNAYETIFKDSLAHDSDHIYIYPDHAYLGDGITMILKASAGGPFKVYFIGSYVDCVIYSSNKITIPASGWAIIRFIWDGRTWVEVSRSWNS
jgi:hypothetical protein